MFVYERSALDADVAALDALTAALAAETAEAVEDAPALDAIVSM
jgi:hypothetical protein